MTKQHIIFERLEPSKLFSSFQAKNRKNGRVSIGAHAQRTLEVKGPFQG